MRISESFQRTLQRIQEIQTRIEQIQGRLPQANAPQFAELVPPVGFPASGGLPPGFELQPAGNLASHSFPPEVQRWEPLVGSIAQRYGLDTEFILRIIEAESGGNPNAVSPKGAIGLMQLMPDTARALGVQNPYDPVQNIEGGVRYLRHLLDRFGDRRLALAAYNAGPGNVQRYGGVPPFPETIRYLQKILG